MKNHFFIVVLFLFILPAFNLQAQIYKADSLRQVYKVAKHDTAKVRLLDQIGMGESNMRSGYWDTLKTKCELLLSKTPDPSSKKIYQKHLASASHNLGFIYDKENDIARALELYQYSLKIREGIKDKKGMAYSLNQIASLYSKQGAIAKSIELYDKSLKISEETNDLPGVALALNNIALVYKGQGELVKALEYYQKSLKIRRETNDPQGEALSLNNIGVVYYLNGDTVKALEYYHKSLKIREELQDLSGVAQCLNNIGVAYDKRQDYAKALEYYQKSLKIQEEINDKKKIAYTYANIGALYFKQKKIQQAEENLLKSLQIGKELGFPEHIRTASKVLYEIYKLKGNTAKALEMHEQYILMRDSLNNIETRKAGLRSQLKYEYEKKAVADSIAFSKEKEIQKIAMEKQEAELKAKRNQQYALYGGLILVITFAGFMVNRFRVTNRQKKLIEHQKDIVEEKQKEILDSIRYAKRIQTALLPNEKYIDRKLNELNEKS